MKADETTIDVVIPAFNEAESLPLVLAAIPRPPVRRVVVTDNNSTDETAQVAHSGGAEVVFESHPGYGGACLRALRHLRENQPPDVVVFLDADFSDHPEELPRVVAPIVDGTADLVIGSRVLGVREPGALLPQARAGNLVACLLIRLLYRHRYTDLGPFRAVRWEALEALAMPTRFYADAEVMFDVPGSAFIPPPKVTSSVIRLVRRTEKPLDLEDEAGFFKFVRAGFKAPRKQLHNSLARGLIIEVSEASEIIEKADLDNMDIHPQFLREIGGWQKHERALELSELLGESFLRYDGTGDVPSQIHGYLSTNFKELRNLPKDHPGLRAKAKDRWYVADPNKAGDLEKLRERTLLREFEEYRESTQKRLKVFRLEAVRAGFKRAWQERDYETIIAVARKVPENVLHEDPKLLMWYDQSTTRKGESA